MGSLPSLRATGHKVWSRIRPNLINLAPRVTAEARLQALRVEVQRLSTVRSQVERATQLARVLDAVSAMAEAHGLTDAELDALRSAPVVAGPSGFRQQLKQRATDVVAQVWAQGPLTSISELAFGAATAPAAGPAARSAADGAASAKGQSAAPAAAAPGEVPSTNTQSSTAAAPGQGRRRSAAPARVAPAERVSARERGTAPGGSPFVLRVGAGRAAGRAGLQLVAASVLHLPRVHRQLHAVRRRADRAMQSAGFAMQGAGFAMQGAGFALQHVRLPQLAATNPVGVDTLASRAAAGIPPRPVRSTTTRLLLWSGRSGLHLTYEIASAGAQLLLRRYVLPRVLRYLSSSMAPARGARRAPNNSTLQNA